MSFKKSYYQYCGKNHKMAFYKNVRFFTGLFFFSLLSVFLLNLFFPQVFAKKTDKLTQLKENKMKNNYEVFGFAPHWTLHRMDNVDFSVLTTLAYFGLPIKADGSIDTASPGYKKFHSKQATELFERAHKNGTRVVATLTQMDNPTIKAFLDNPEAQDVAIREVVREVRSRGIDGINVDFEYLGNPGSEYRAKFSAFVNKISQRMHSDIEKSNVTVSVYASSAKFSKMYDIATLAHRTDGIFMMAYDFATTGSTNAMPTAPLYGYKEGKYWYDISTAVDDFLAQMPKNKLILGLPWYGYDYPVSSPAIKAPKDSGYYTSYWYKRKKYTRFVARPAAFASTYALTKNQVVAAKSGWDEVAQVGWEAYQGKDGWRMIFLDDEKSLGIKYDFAKTKGLLGVGMWALGFDHGKTEMWELLEEKFGKKLVASNI